MARNLLGMLLILAAVGTAILWTHPLWLSLGEMRQEKIALESIVKRFQDLKKIRDDILATYNAISPADLARLEEFLPKSENMGIFLVNIERLSLDHDVLLKQINIESGREREGSRESVAAAPPETGGVATGKAKGLIAAAGPATLPVSFSIAGSYDAFRSFLEAIEKNLRLIDIETISFNAAAGGKYDFSVKAAAYWYKR